MQFLNPFFLFGLAASALPVLFHLFARKRSRRVEFSSLRFLQKLEKTSMRAVKLRQWLLLLIRTLLITAIVLAFARPALRGYLGSFLGSSHANTSMVLLIDNSASMSRSDERGELLKQAKSAAMELASLLEDGDEATVVPLASLSRGATFSPMHTKRDVLRAINETRIADRPAALQDGLRFASSILARSMNVNKEVYLISDDQARNIRPEISGAEPTAATVRDAIPVIKLFDASTKLIRLSVGSGTERSLARNLSLDSMRPATTVFEPGRPIQFDAWVRNTTSERAENVVLSLFYNDERVAQKTINAVEPLASGRVEIEGPIRGAGLISVRAELEPDALPFDNARYGVVTVPASRRIGIFMQDASNARFLQLALEQTLTDRDGAGVPFTVELKRLEDLRSLPSLGARFDGIMVGLGPQSLSDLDRTALAEYLGSGHGATIFLMKGLAPEVANRDLAALGLPRVTQKEGEPGDASHFLSFASFDLAHPFFAGMFEATARASDVVRGVQSPRIFEAYDLQSTTGITLVKMSNGFPFVSECRVGKGDVILFAVPPTLDFSDFPRKSVFLPLIRRSGAFVSAVASQRDESQQVEYVTTEPFDVDLPPMPGEQSGATVLVRSPDGASERQKLVISPEGRPRIHVDAAGVAGNYTVFRDAEARVPIAAFSVNIQSDESDLRLATSAQMDDFLRARSSASKPAVIALAASDPALGKRVKELRFGVELWQSFLWAALVLAILEMIVAREPRTRIVAAASA